MSGFTTLKRFVLVAPMLALFVSQSAQALVAYDSFARSEFELIADGGMSITIEPSLDGLTMLSTGTGFASTDIATQVPGPPGPHPFTVGSILTQTSKVSGSADAPQGTSMAAVLQGTLVTLSNDSTSPATATFRFFYEWDALVTRDSVAHETGMAAPFFHLSGFAPSGEETLMIDEMMGGGFVSVADWLVAPGEFLPLGMGPLVAMGSSAGVTVLAAVTVPGKASPIDPPHVDEFSVITDSTGNASHNSTPEPAAITLVGLGLATLLRRRREKQAGWVRSADSIPKRH